MRWTLLRMGRSTLLRRRARGVGGAEGGRGGGVCGGGKGRWVEDGLVVLEGGVRGCVLGL